jgi:Cytochrome C assembly protein
VWLATHVVMVTLGYSSVALAGFLGIIYICRGLFITSFDETTARSISRMMYGIICFATLFSFVGTILGGIWADQSWGRYGSGVRNSDDFHRQPIGRHGSGDSSPETLVDSRICLARSAGAAEKDARAHRGPHCSDREERRVVAHPAGAAGSHADSSEFALRRRSQSCWRSLHADGRSGHAVFSFERTSGECRMESWPPALFPGVELPPKTVFATEVNLTRVLDVSTDEIQRELGTNSAELTQPWRAR